MNQITINTERGQVQYTPVHERVKTLKESKVDHSLTTEYEYIETEKRFIVTARLTVYGTGKERVYTGHASEVVGEGNDANIFSALENAETSAVGRALAFYGIGIDNAIASAEEVKPTSPESVVQSLDSFLQTLTTEEDVKNAAAAFKKKYPQIFAQTSVQKKFKKRIGEVIIKKGEQ